MARFEKCTDSYADPWYAVIYTGPDGRRHREDDFETLADAKAWWQENSDLETGPADGQR